ncbi:MAG: multicopper oxidase domain-containing protein [Propionibacteriaceae bacterium]|nr:multicopper oxidase domain-containing protein [Propionibacteriaceae bacterium]
MSRPSARGRSRLRDLPLLGWLLAAVIVAIVHRWLPDANWLMLHLVLLGALTHSIIVWSFHFTQTLLRSPASPRDASWQATRLGLVAGGAAAVLVGVPTDWWPLTLAGGLAVATAAVWHGLVLWRMLRRALPARFQVTVRYYLWAAASLVLGAGLGVTLAWGWPDPWHGRLLVAHALANVLGWVGLTLTGTLLTLWPTMLRTQLDPTAERWTRQALPVLTGAIAVGVAGALAGIGPIAGLGVLAYLAGLCLWGRGLWRPIRKSPPREFGPASVAIGLVWLMIGLTWASWLLATAPDWQVVREGFAWPAAALGAGFGVQVLTGALSYLLPSVLGGGPSVVRAGQAWFNRAGSFRLIAINGGLALWLLPTTSWVKVTGSLLALAAAASFLPLMVLGLRASIAARKLLIAVREGEVAEPDPPQPPRVERPSIFTAGQLIAGLTALATAVVIGVGVDPAAAGITGVADALVQPTGKTVKVEVTAIGMRYTPSEIHVDAGDRLVVELVNSDTTTHDLVIGSARTPRIAPGSRTELDAGVIGASTTAYCSVPGHRQMGMVLAVIVDNAPAAPGASSPPPTHDMDQMGHHPTGSNPSTPPTAQDVLDPVLAPLNDEREHRITLTVQELPLEVAPGVWQRRWTYNGHPVGPTLHGRVGDTFVITLVNDGSMGHSIDFHAGSLAPDRPMRTIEPGESLTYRFTATKAGIWMYHCSTMPMSAHIAAGMAGAVVIEPDGLPQVDRSYLLVQSEVYLQTRATDAASATEVNADLAATGQPSYVVFNGVANGYDTRPLTARVGERVRVWVLDAGPNHTSSFHIVGAQFDTVLTEGSYQLKRGRDPFGDHGGAQALGLQPAQGGFVETVFPEAGRYPVVTHIMADAERGAHGYVQVGP